MSTINAEFWEKIKRAIVEQNQGNQYLMTWLKPITFVELTGTLQVPKIILGVPSVIHQYFAIENLNEQIHSEISTALKTPFEVDIVIAKNPGSQSDETLSVSEAAVFEAREAPGTTAVTPSPVSASSSIRPNVEVRTRDSLNSSHTFSTFVVGRNNEFAHAASYNIADNPGVEGNNPLVICGPPGMGKTHLLHAVGNHIRQTQPQFRLLYVHGENFLNECVSAIRRNETEKFRQKYRDSADILLVDDVQFIGKGERTSEEFFHMINSFLEQRKQTVIASDRMPRDLPGIEDRNRSRLEWGLIVDITMPDFETRVAILRFKAELLNVRLNEEVINYIAKISKRSIRELEGNLKKVKMFSELQCLPIDLSLAKKVLTNHETQTSISVEEIQRLVADQFKVRIQDLKSTTRSKQIVIPRQISMYLIKKHLDKSLVDIGHAFGGKDHTTVMNALDRVQHLLSTDLDIKNHIEDLTSQIHNITGL